MRFSRRLRNSWLLLAVASLAGSSIAQASLCGDLFSDLSIEQGLVRRNIEQGLFNQDRGLRMGPDQPVRSYEFWLGSSFFRLLWRLGPGQWWFDIGGGKAKAARDYLGEGGRANVSVVVLNRPQDPQMEADLRSLGWQRLRYRSGKPFESSELRFNEGERAHLLTDVFGAFSYSTRLDSVIEKMGEVLVPGGEALVVFRSDLISIRRGAQGSPMVAIEQFFREFVQGFTVLEVDPLSVQNLETGSKPGDVVKLHLRRDHGRVTVPVLKLVGLKDGAPPRLEYEIESSP